METYVAGISVLVCTYNGKQNLPATLTHLSSQQVEADLPWEILLIDNASTDDTAHVARQTWQRLGVSIPFTIINEPKPGKDNAIDTGLRSAQYAYVLICDDDNWLAKDYVQTAFRIMQAHPRIGMLGGRGTPVFEVEPPVWFSQFENYYAVGRQNATSGEVTTNKGFLWGAGAVINRLAYRKLIHAGFRRIITYEQYPRIARGEDVELCLALKLTGYQIWYDERLQFRHYIADAKLNWNYVKKLVKEGAIMGVILRGYYQAQKKADTGNLQQHTWRSHLIRHLYSGKALKKYGYLLFRNSTEGNADYLKTLYYFQYTHALLTLNRKVDEINGHILNLASALKDR